jgi:hypothetical protein
MVDRRALLLDKLAEVEQQVAESARRIQGQKKSIAEMQPRARETAIAAELLKVALRGHAVLVAARDRLKVRISQL